ncbi:cation:proton antiporter [Pseudomonas schmalbachii]|uniref:Cation:proton antiporter n=1 Tax=Pseudomonas schmalbachii TaxID=2816993 RepID=A0ABS3TJB8_9PSED|nr:cation:proton antiporter [Pseudomonas schmalbachii]MBO3273754.1 cation:proton antiporter [Pseudomonas schmalbachii]
MTEIWTQAALWLGLALLATLVSIYLRVATALSEIVVGTIAQLIIGAALGAAVLQGDASWIRFLSGAGAILLTFLAGAELDPQVFRRQWKQATAIGLVSFAVPFLGCAALARWGLGWEAPASWLAGIAMSTTSVAVVYAVMLELEINTTEFGKVVLAACFVTDLATVVALGLIFAPFTLKTVSFVAALTLAALLLPWITPRFFRRFGGRPSELEAKFLMLCLFGLGAIATWADSEAVLPAYLIGMVLAGTVGKDHALIRRLRTLTFGLLTPFYFIRAGSLVSLPELAAAPAAFLLLLLVKMLSKFVGVYPVCQLYGSPHREGMYTTLLMSTGLTFGTISALFGLSHGLIDQGQYSALVAAVIGSAVIPTLIANAFFLPRHLLQRGDKEEAKGEVGETPAAGSGASQRDDVRRDAAQRR